MHNILLPFNLRTIFDPFFSEADNLGDISLFMSFVLEIEGIMDSPFNRHSHHNHDNKGTCNENGIISGQEVGVIIELDLSESVVHRTDFFNPRKVWLRPERQCLSWLTKTQPGFSTDFLSLQDAESIIEFIRDGKDYQNEAYKNCCPQNSITNVVSRLDDLVGASIAALQLVQASDRNKVFQFLQPIQSRVPDKYRNFVDMQGGLTSSQGFPPCLSQSCIEKSSSQFDTPQSDHCTNASSMTGDNVSEGKKPLAHDSTKDTEQARNKLCWELHQESKLSIPQIIKKLKEEFGKDISVSESSVRQWGKNYHKANKSGIKWKSRKAGRHPKNRPH